MQIKIPTPIRVTVSLGKTLSPLPIISTTTVTPATAPKIAIAASKLAKPAITAASIQKVIATTVQAESTPPVTTTTEFISDIPAFEETSITAQLSHIEALMEQKENLPIERLKSGLKDVMLCITANENSILELEPTDIRLIVQGYLTTADEEVRAILEGKKKKAKKPAKATARLEKIAKETDLDSVDF